MSEAPAGRVALDRASVFYGGVLGLSQLSLALEPGITGIVGPNGSGKTSVMRVLAGLVPLQEGTARVFGHDPFRDARARARTAIVPATENFHDDLDARDNLVLASCARGEPLAAARERAARVLASIGLAADAARAYRTWSRGMRQRLKLAWALSLNAELVLLDEPFTGVDPASRVALREAILRLGGERVVLVSSHVLPEIESLTDRVAILSSGRLLGHGRVETLRHELRDLHPHRIRIRGSRLRELALDLLRHTEVREVRLPSDDEAEIVTTIPERTYQELPHAIGRCGSLVWHVDTPDDTLEAVFEQVLGAHVHRGELTPHGKPVRALA